MEKISDFFKDLKERVSSPLFSSFILAWIVFNWKIIIGLFFYKVEDLQLDNYTSYIDLIQKNTLLFPNLIYPLSAALAYTFGYPYLRNQINIFTARRKAWGNKATLKAMKTSTISIEKFIALRETYLERIATLQNLLDKEAAKVTENELLEGQIQGIQHQNNNLETEIANWKKAKSSNLIDGEWEVHGTTTLTNEPYVTKIRIQHENFQVLSTSPMSEKFNESMRSFYQDPTTGQTTFTTMRETTTANNSTQRSYHYYVLQPLDTMQILRGRVDEQYNIEFRKIKD